MASYNHHYTDSTIKSSTKLSFIVKNDSAEKNPPSKLCVSSTVNTPRRMKAIYTRQMRESEENEKVSFPFHDTLRRVPLGAQCETSLQQSWCV